MRIIYFFLITLLSAGVFAQTPITLGNTNMPSSGDTLRYTTVVLNTVGNYTLTGTNYAWDFSNVTLQTEGVRTFKSPAQTPYALFFLSFTGFAEKMPDYQLQGFPITDYYNFYKKLGPPTNTLNAFIADGVGLTFSSVPLPSYYTDKDELYIFPMTYPKYDSTKFRFTTTPTGFLPKYTKTGYRVTKVDGWGTVKTPYGTENCLRLVTTQYGMDSLKMTTPIPLSFGFPNVMRSYQWMTLNSKIPYFEVSGSVLANTFTPTEARFRGYKKTLPPPPPPPPDLTGLSANVNNADLSIYPNPATSHMVLEGLSGLTLIRIYDLNGSLVKTALIGASGNTADIEISTLSSGLYCLKLFTETGEQHLKFIKE